MASNASAQPTVSMPTWQERQGEKKAGRKKRSVENRVSAHLFVGRSTTQLVAIWKEEKESGPIQGKHATIPSTFIR